MKEGEINTDPLVEAKLEAVDMIAELGSAAHGINETIRLFDDGKDLLSEEACEMAEDSLRRLARIARETRVKLTMWRGELAMKGTV